MEHKRTRSVAAKSGALISALILGGCATMSEGQFQTIRVETQQADGRAVEGLACRLSNKKGLWQVQSPGDVRVQRSAEPLILQCESAQWQMQDSQSMQDSSSDLTRSVARGAGVGAGVGMLVGALAPITLPFVGPAVALSVAAGGAAGAVYGGAGGAVIDAASGAAFDYAPRITVLVKPRLLQQVAAPERAASAAVAL